MTPEEKERVLRELFDAIERRDPSCDAVEDDFTLVGSLTRRDPTLTTHSLGERLAAMDAEFSSWFISLRGVVHAPDGRVVAILASGSRAHGGGGSSQLGAAVYGFSDDRRIAGGHSFQDIADALESVGLPRDHPWRVADEPD